MFSLLRTTSEGQTQSQVYLCLPTMWITARDIAALILLREKFIFLDMSFLINVFPFSSLQIDSQSHSKASPYCNDALTTVLPSTTSPPLDNTSPPTLRPEEPVLSNSIPNLAPLSLRLPPTHPMINHCKDGTRKPRTFLVTNHPILYCTCHLRLGLHSKNLHPTNKQLKIQSGWLLWRQRYMHYIPNRLDSCSASAYNECYRLQVGLRNQTTP